MDFRSLQIFKHLAQSLHFGKTAEAMYISPSTLSRVIQRLEDEVGSSLLVRDNRTAKLTPAGQRFLVFAEEITRQWQTLQGDINEQMQALQGELSLFCTVTASVSHLPPLLEGFRDSHPRVEIKLATGNPGESVQRVMEQSSDLAIAIHTPNFPQELYFQHLDQVPLVMITPKKHPARKISDLVWTDEQMILPDIGPSKRIVHHWLSEQGIRPRVYASVGGNEAILSMVALGCGIAIVPEIVVHYSTIADKVNIIEINNIESYRLGLCCLEKRRDEPVIKAFFEQI
ncbi:HTH-type transcriptional activator IlvY [Planctobacterium marinum]|uniref:HTH-type transcriptional activator IlvY n=1 Tax=Planctobacterium marinum TaxID=1631968 RepID=UPI001E38CE1C|nr:HTH-type transcriptional activator IlvY [Planctobacterium marinum]MCC2606591.1 HTH-type transcriptional activator IlvY [Planctobacterium marinum]